jgi:hypothetical protein
VLLLVITLAVVVLLGVVILVRGVELLPLGAKSADSSKAVIFIP